MSDNHSAPAAPAAPATFLCSRAGCNREYTDRNKHQREWYQETVMYTTKDGLRTLTFDRNPDDMCFHCPFNGCTFPPTNAPNNLFQPLQVPRQDQKTYDGEF